MFLLNKLDFYLQSKRKLENAPYAIKGVANRLSNYIFILPCPLFLNYFNQSKTSVCLPTAELVIFLHPLHTHSFLVITSTFPINPGKAAAERAPVTFSSIRPPFSADETSWPALQQMLQKLKPIITQLWPSLLFLHYYKFP